MKWFDWVSLSGVACVIVAGFVVYLPLGLFLAGASCLVVGIGANRVLRAQALRKGEEYD